MVAVFFCMTLTLYDYDPTEVMSVPETEGSAVFLVAVSHSV